MDPIIISGVTSFITTLATKGAEGPGKTLDLLWNYTFFNTNKFFEAGIAKKETLNDFQQEIKDNIQSIPDENIQSPRKSIVASALESSRNHLDEPEIRTMFSKLIANAFDNSLINEMHPSYNEIIKQLSPVDALLLKTLNSNGRCPIAKYNIIANESGGNLDLSDYFVLPLLNDYTQTVISIDNLERLKLIKIGYGEFLSNESLYSAFYNPNTIHDILFQNEKAALKLQIDMNMQRDPSKTLISDNVELKKSFIELTPYGKSFFNICCS